ncbi:MULTISPECIES: type VII secretion protein EsaA [unclassified Enterococcus]|uniref:type VII secretion protein EsaA n=1 Tax=unclassified Enterococcus TaxID=2608891 RepID=UPI0015528D35|nr:MULTISPECIES: type VII secretion protein EsaA [unclassified Enterococcus]MBS7576423.1 type VII secretion protein EsaA [Enterococcus sp. MMGLQ5-2]MBS7583655.1 type VII secretion protein EsaA [Enterococcus sp. MMGLQ5-1]NPD11516.1 type VII secretion protein EsaA [Enterococcus sp. MMGLQ5-1]NPD36260.1 type VII secretion protein EsaA [Enterococcus sp. MMGLQ5-2]
MNQQQKVSKFPNKFYLLSIAGIIILLIISISLLLFLNKKTAAPEKSKKPVIALVNEDESSNFNQQTYSLGKNFVDSVSNDNNYQWRVVSRAVASKALEDKNVDAVIYLPKTFSHDILTLQDINPIKSQVEYQIQKQSDTLSDRILQEKIVNVIYDFNQTVVKMYYGSVAGNIAEAENQMNGSLGKQENLVTNLSNQVDVPFKESMTNYITFISGSNSLKGINQANVASQNSFTEVTTNLLNQTSESFNSQLPQINSYFDLQKKISETNLTNSNGAITEQATGDEKYYFNQYDGFNTNMLTNLAGFYKNDEASEASGQLVELTQKINAYNQLISAEKDKLSDQEVTLKAKRDELLTLEQKLYQQFYNQADLTISMDNFDTSIDQLILDPTKEARLALADKIINSFSNDDNKLDPVYTNQLAELIGEISLNPADYMLEDLATNGSLTEAQKQEYINKLQVISNYANQFGITTKIGTSLNVLPPNDVSIDQYVDSTIQVKVPAKTKYISNVFPSNVKINSIVDGDSMPVAPNLNNSVTLDNTAEDTASKTFTLNLRIDLKDVLNQSASSSLSIDWTNATTGSKDYQSNLEFVLSLKDSLADYSANVGIKQFYTFTDYFNKINQITNQIALIYGEPGSDYTRFLNASTQNDFLGDKLRPSIYNLYNNISKNNGAIADRLSETDVNSFNALGQQNIEDVVKTIQTLNDSIDKLQANQTQLNSNLPDDYFSSNLTSLSGWYRETMENIEVNYQAWQKNQVNQLPIKDWNSYNSEEQALYVDNSNQLYEQINTLITSTTQASASTTQSARQVEDNSASFDDLVASASNTQQTAQKISNNATNLTLSGSQDLATSQSYFTNFSKTLANTRTQGVDTNQIYDFFVNPISALDVSPKQTVVTASQTDFRWPIVFVIGVLAGVLSMLGLNWLNKRRPPKNNLNVL